MQPTPEDIAALAADLRGEPLVEDAPDKESTSTDKAEAAAKSESEEDLAADKTSDEVESDSSDVEGQEEQEKVASKGRSQALQKLIDTKYGGDEDKFVEGLYEQWNSSSRLKQDLEELKRAVAKPAISPQVAEQLINEDPELNALSSRVKNIDVKVTRTVQRQSSILTELATTEREIAKMEGRAEKADDYDKQVLEAKRDQLQNKRDGLAREFQDLDEKLSGLEETKSETQLRFNHAKRQAEAAVRQYSEEAESKARFNASLVDTFTKTALKYAAENGVPEKNWDYMIETVKAQGALYLRSRKDSDPNLTGFEEDELDDLVSSKIGVYAEKHGFSRAKDFTNTSKAKLVKTSKPAVSAKPTFRDAAQVSATIKEPKKWTPEFVKMRAAKILGN